MDHTKLVTGLRNWLGSVSLVNNWSTSCGLLLFILFFRYKTLERLDQERMLILLRHLGFIGHGPVRATCPAGPVTHCMDRLIGRVLQRAPRPRSWARSSAWALAHSETGEQKLNVVLFATKSLLHSFSHFFKVSFKYRFEKLTIPSIKTLLLAS